MTRESPGDLLTRGKRGGYLPLVDRGSSVVLKLKVTVTEARSDRHEFNIDNQCRGLESRILVLRRPELVAHDHNPQTYVV